MERGRDRYSEQREVCDDEVGLLARFRLWRRRLSVDVKRRWMVVYTVIERLVRSMERRRERSRESMVRGLCVW